MKNISVALNVVLLIAVAVLYYLHFSSNNPERKVMDSSSRMENATIVYVNSDSLVKKYDFIKDKQKELKATQKKLDTEFKNRAQGLQAEFNSFQQNAALMTIGQARAVEENLMKKQQNLKMYEQTLTQQLIRQEAKIAQELYEKVSKTVALYGVENNIHMIMKYSQGSDVLYANNGMDITNDILERLNSAYKNANHKENDNGVDSLSVNNN